MRGILLAAVVLVLLAALGLRAAYRHSVISDVRTATTGLSWPADSDVLELSSDSSFQSAHSSLKLRIPEDERALFLANTPKLTVDGCRASSPSTVFQGPAPSGLRCIEGSSGGPDWTQSWRATFDAATGELSIGVDSFW